MFFRTLLLLSKDKRYLKTLIEINYFWKFALVFRYHFFELFLFKTLNSRHVQRTVRGCMFSLHMYELLRTYHLCGKIEHAAGTITSKLQRQIRN